MKDDKRLDFYDKEVADQVADEILTVEEDDRGLFYLILVFLICLIFLIASLAFAIFNNYYNGDSTNVIDIDTDVIVDQTPKKHEESSPYRCIPRRKTTPKKKIEAGTILFSFNEISNNIYMTNVIPTKDEVGMKLTGDKEYFDFNVSATMKNIKKGKIVYEISLVPLKGNTIPENDIRVYLTENGKNVSINSNTVNNYSNLPNSKYRSNGKVIFRKTITKSSRNDYVFRMWYSYAAKVTKDTKQFGCKVAVDAYYE